MRAAWTPFRYIREIAFAEPIASRFAEAIRVSPAHLSRLESGDTPSYGLMLRTRELARHRGVRWDDRWFFEPPPGPPVGAQIPPHLTPPPTHVRAAEDCQ